MDIRNFFTKKDGSGSSSQPTTTTTTTTTTKGNGSQATSSGKKPKPSGSKKSTVDSTSHTNHSNARKQGQQIRPVVSRSEHEKQEEEEEEEEEYQPKPSKSSNEKSRTLKPRGKRKVIIDDDDDDDGDDDDKDDSIVEVSASDYFAKTSRETPSSGTNRKRKSETSPSPPSPRRASLRAARKPVEYLEVDDSDTDSVDDCNDRVKKPQPKTGRHVQGGSSRSNDNKSKDDGEDDNEDDDDDDDDDDEKPKAKRKSPSQPSRSKSSTSPGKKARTATTPKKSTTATSNTSLEPTLELDHFSVDDCIVGECLQGQTFVFTGVLDDLDRVAAQDLIKTLGGRVTTAVSSKTSYLVVGEILEDGRPYTEGSKYKAVKAKHTNVKLIMGTKRLYGLCKLYQERAQKEQGIQPTPNRDSLTESTSANPSSTIDTAVPNKPTTADSGEPSPVSNPYAKRPVTNPYAKKAGANNPYAKQTQSRAGAGVATTNPYTKRTLPPKNIDDKDDIAAATDKYALWVDKHAPNRTQDILGNQENIKKLKHCKSTCHHASVKIDSHIRLH